MALESRSHWDAVLCKSLADRRWLKEEGKHARLTALPPGRERDKDLREYASLLWGDLVVTSHPVRAAGNGGTVSDELALERFVQFQRQTIPLRTNRGQRHVDQFV